MNNRAKFRVGNLSHARYFFVGPGFPISAIALKTLRVFKFKRSLYKSTGKILENREN